MPMSSGLSALIRLGAALELEPDVSLETLAIGQLGNSLTGSYELETAGRWLCYTVTIAGSEHVLVSASPVDSVNPPEVLLKVRDTEPEWETVFHLVRTLEKAGVKSLERPIEAIGDSPETSWIIV
jgi:hypothetical protein